MESQDAETESQIGRLTGKGKESSNPRRKPSSLQSTPLFCIVHSSDVQGKQLSVPALSVHRKLVLTDAQGGGLLTYFPHESPKPLDLESCPQKTNGMIPQLICIQERGFLTSKIKSPVYPENHCLPWEVKHNN